MRQDLMRATVIGLMMLLGWFAPEASAMLNPSQGRFMQRDPLGYVDGMGLHEYVRSAPVKLVDPKGLQQIGLFPIDDTGGGGCWPRLDVSNPELDAKRALDAWAQLQRLQIANALKRLCETCVGITTLDGQCCRSISSCEDQAVALADSIVDWVRADLENTTKCHFSGWAGDLVNCLPGIKNNECTDWQNTVVNGVVAANPIFVQNGQACFQGRFVDAKMGSWKPVGPTKKRSLTQHHWVEIRCRNGRGKPVVLDPWHSGGRQILSVGDNDGWIGGTVSTPFPDGRIQSSPKPNIGTGGGGGGFVELPIQAF